jgi:Uma2 family endonuclease
MIRAKHPERGEPVWELAHLFPSQGTWTEKDYLALDTNLLIEYSQGFLEVLPTPTREHQRIVGFLYRLLFAFVESRNLAGEVLFAPLRVKLAPGEIREPDVIYIALEAESAAQNKYPEGRAVGIAMEVVSGSPADRDRDLVRKRGDYALAGIPKYWIVDPEEGAIIVLRLEGTEYVEHGRFSSGETATSHLLPGFSVPVDDTWAAAQP